LDGTREEKDSGQGSSFTAALARGFTQSEGQGSETLKLETLKVSHATAKLETPKREPQEFKSR
jgi:hypothetical protein